MATIQTPNRTAAATKEHSTESLPTYASMTEAERYLWSRRHGKEMRVIARRHRAALSTVSDVLHGKLKSFGPTRPGFPKDTKARRIGRSLNRMMSIETEHIADKTEDNGRT